MRKSHLLSTTAVLLVMSGPAFAQSVNQNTFTVTATGVQDSGVINSQINNNLTANSLGTIITGVGSQAGTNQVNAVGGTSPLSLGDSFAINQAAGGGFAYTGPNNGGPSGTFPSIAGSVTQNTANTIGATSGSNAISAALGGGNQSAINSTNSALFAPAIGGVGSVTQAGGAVTSSASNAITSTVNNGNALIQGSNGSAAGFQTAATTLNTATLQQGAGLTGAPSGTPTSTLTLGQKIFPTPTRSATNSAIANSIASLPSLDPSVSGLNQSSSVGANQLSLASAGYTSGSSTTVVPSLVNLGGSQNLNAPNNVPQQAIAPGVLSVKIGNTAAAYAGALGTIPTPAAAADGTSQISGMKQTASLGLNNVVGGSATSIDFSNAVDPATGFTQNASLGTGAAGSPVTLTVPTFNTGAGASITGVGGAGTVNLLAAGTRTGNSNITGSSSELTQAFRTDVNTISTGGSTTGIVTQNAANLAPTGAQSPMQNLANASSANGVSTLTNVSQAGSQNVNSFGAGAGGVNLALNQTSTGTNLSNSNDQVAAGSTRSAITGAVQLGNLSLNTAQLGTVANAGLGTSQLTQQAGATTFNNTNNLTAGAASGNRFNATVNGTQQATSAINVVR